MLIAVVASLDTKLNETLYAKTILEENGCEALLVDTSTWEKDIGVPYGAVTPDRLVSSYNGMGWDDFRKLGKAECIDIMGNALTKAVVELYAERRFDGIISVGGGQNARMAAIAMKALPFGLPKIVASALACGARTMEQYVGDKDIMVLHTVADIAGLNAVTKKVIENVCNAVYGMAAKRREAAPNDKKKIALTMLGITSKGVDGVMRRLPDETFEKTCFHANGVGGRCMDNLIRDGAFDLVADLTLHEITCEILGGYCQGANNRLMAAIEKNIPMVVAPGAIDMLDFYVDERGNGLPPDIEKRKKVYHNPSVCHSKIFPEEAARLAEVVASRLNMAKAPVTLILPDDGFCAAAATGLPMHDAEADVAFISTVKEKLGGNVKVIDVKGNINGDACQEAIAQSIKELLFIETMKDFF